MIVELTPSLILSIIGTLISVASMLFAYVNSAKKLERRLTAIEYTLEYKLEPLWDAVRTQIPKMLISPHSQELDKLLKMASNGLDEMTDQQVQEMASMLDKEYSKAVKTGDAGRAVGIALFRASLKERSQDDL